MNRVRIAALINFEANPFQQRVSYIHSTPILERKRRTHRDSRFSNYSRKNRKLQAKQEMLHNIISFAEQLYQDFKGNGFKKGKSKNKGQPAWNTRFQFFVDNDDYEVETIYKSTFDGNNYCYYSFTDDEPYWKDLSSYFNNHKFYWSWGRQDEKEDKSSSLSSSDRLQSDLTSDRLALGLDSSGPLSLTDVKKAYRASTLKWHQIATIVLTRLWQKRNSSFAVQHISHYAISLV